MAYILGRTGILNGVDEIRGCKERPNEEVYQTWPSLSTCLAVIMSAAATKQTAEIQKTAGLCLRALTTTMKPERLLSHGTMLISAQGKRSYKASVCAFDQYPQSYSTTVFSSVRIVRPPCLLELTRTCRYRESWSDITSRLTAEWGGELLIFLDVFITLAPTRRVFTLFLAGRADDMQGTFERAAGRLLCKDTDAEFESGEEEEGSSEGGECGGGSGKDGDCEQARCSDRQGKQTRLEAISNVPWSELLVPGNDRDTQKRMRVHQGKEAQYNALSYEQKDRKPRVMPYPQSPDRVFPGTPCYRIVMDGVYRFVFVVDLDDPLISAVAPPMQNGQPWDGKERRQSRGYWIVPHFIYRDEARVTLHHNRWEAIYIRNVIYNAEPGNVLNGRSRTLPSKFDYDSQTQLPPAELPAGTRDPAGFYQGVDPHDTYYVCGTRNDAAGCPEIKDPVFCRPFNTRPDGLVTPPGPHPVPIRFEFYVVAPFPYEQPTPPFPQKPDPPVIFPRAPPAPAAPPSRRRRAPAAPAAPLPPFGGALEVDPPTYHGVAGKDWISMSAENFEIGSRNLKDNCLQAEEADYAFALRMQGLRGSSLPSVWNCQDPAYDVTDRSAVLAQFVKLYMEKFYNRVEVGASTSDVQEVIHEALAMHEEFCKGWVERHHRTLAPSLVSAAEALVGVFYPSLKGAFPGGVDMTRTCVARYFWRHKELSGEFSYCLYHFMTSLEQLRGNRNASYRAMQGEKQSEITAMKRMGAMLQEKYASIAQELSAVRSETLLFDPRFIDWHYISSQLPAHHKEFDGYLNSFSLFRTRPGGRGSQFPPWQQLRFRG